MLTNKTIKYIIKEKKGKENKMKEVKFEELKRIIEMFNKSREKIREEKEKVKNDKL